MARSRQFDEAEVMERALAAFWTRGVAATTMQDLAAATGVQRGSLYNAYGDREAIFLRAYDLYSARFLAQVRASMAASDARGALHGFFGAAIASMTTGAPARGCLTTRTAADGSIASDAVRARLRLLLADLTGAIASGLSPPVISAGLTCAPERAAALIVTFSRGLAVMERVHGDGAKLMAEAADFIDALLGADGPPDPRSARRP